MKKFILILISTFFLTACAPSKVNKSSNTANNNNAQKSIEQPVVAQAVVPSKADDPELTLKKEGITVTISNIKKTTKQTVVDFMVDNHIYDISSMDVAGLSSLNGIKPNDYLIEKVLMGGHHINAKMTFPGELSGPLVIGLKNSITFNFDI